MKCTVYILFFLLLSLPLSSCRLIRKSTDKFSRTETITIDNPVIVNSSIRDSVVIIIPPKIIRDTINIAKLTTDTFIIRQTDDLIMEIRIDSIRNKIYAECRQANSRIEYRERIVEKPVIVEKFRNRDVVEVRDKVAECPSLFWYTVKTVGITILVISVLLFISRITNLVKI